MLRSVLALVVSAILCQLVAADLRITGKWMVTELKIVPAEKSLKFKATFLPGGLTYEIGDGTMTCTVAIPGEDPNIQTTTFTIVTRAKDSVTILVTSPQKKDGEKTVITADGAGLIWSDSQHITKMIPYDATAVAKEKQRFEEGNKPADPLKDQPLSGHLNGIDWKPIECRRSYFQFDEDKIQVDVTVDRIKGLEPSAFPNLIINLPTKPGEYKLSNVFNFTVHTPPSDNNPITNGILTVFKVTDTAIEFGLTARGTDGNIVNGKMTANVSPLKDQ